MRPSTDPALLQEDPSPPADLGVFIGRFQPLHRGHLEVIRQGLTAARRLLIVIGSADAARRADLLPFTADERREMILGSLDEAEASRIELVALPDLSDLKAWAAMVEGAARATLEAQGKAGGRVRLVGCSKDRSSYYLKAFPGWDGVAVPVVGGLSATTARLAFFDRDPDAVDRFLAGEARRDLPPFVVDWLRRFREGPRYQPLVEELAWAQDYRQAWSAAPYPPTFVTADAVVIHRGHVLLIRRKRPPGQGLWALPGGFVEPDEFLVDAALRELREETGLGVSEDDLRRAICATSVYDAPYRDMRGRVITHATLFDLSSQTEARPDARAADDAADLRWTPLDALQRGEMFGDHYAIVTGFMRSEASSSTAHRKG